MAVMDPCDGRGAEAHPIVSSADDDPIPWRSFPKDRATQVTANPSKRTSSVASAGDGGVAHVHVRRVSIILENHRVGTVVFRAWV